MKLPLSAKHLQINKANNLMILVVAGATVITVFCLVSSKALLSQASYQRKVINEKHKAADQLKKNVESAKELATQYQVFAAADPNIIGGKGGEQPGEGPTDGDNPRIVLDALPSQYDFPALMSSIEKIVTNAKLLPTGLGGTDEGQDTTGQANSTANPEPLESPFSVEVITSYQGIQGLIKDFERSIRPIEITSIELSGKDATMNLGVQAKTYYQPAKTLVIEEKVVK